MSEQGTRLDKIVMKKVGVSRVAASDLICGGKVKVNGRPVDKPGQKFDGNCDLCVDLPGSMFVGRGGYKLEHALNFFGIELAGRICADIGASTGGFTDCMLQRGALRVYAIENGKGQLAEKLRNDTRVVSLEETNINDLAESLKGVSEPKLPDLQAGVDFISVDVSFVSVTKVIESVCDILKHGGSAVLLVKPQFEAGRGSVSKRGIVKDRNVHDRVIAEVSRSAESAGFRAVGITRSPIEGRDGNIEFLMYCLKL